MVAAARFSDLPELRDLRQIFQERYGNSLDHCLNKEVLPQFRSLLALSKFMLDPIVNQLIFVLIQFMENLAPQPFVMERKVHLMQDIASEFSINWNAKNFEQQMSKASSYEQVLPLFFQFQKLCWNLDFCCILECISMPIFWVNRVFISLQ